VVATPTKYMNNKWYKINKDIKINGYKTVRDALKGGYTSGGSRLPGFGGSWGEYLWSLTCKGTVRGVIKALQN